MTGIVLRPAQPTDVPQIFDLILQLADYEHLTHAVTGSAAELAQHLFGERPFAEAIVATTDTQIIGYALFFYTYSTFLTRPGLYLEDLFVLPSQRRQGIGTALLTAVAQRAAELGCGRLEWSVLDWNQPAITFYEKMGATVLPDWRTCRVTGTALTHLAQRYQS